jgi:hypothetical protein
MSAEREAFARDMLNAAITVRRLVTRRATSNNPGPEFQDLFEAASADQEMIAFLSAAANLSNAIIPIHARTYRGSGKITRRNNA